MRPKRAKRFSFVSAFAMTVFLSFSPVYAGAMLGESAQVPPEEMTPLDEALRDIQGIQNGGNMQKSGAPVSLQPAKKTPTQNEAQQKNIQPAQDVGVVQATKPKPPMQAQKRQGAQAAQTAVPDNRVVHVQPNSSFFGLSVGLFDAVTHDDVAAAFDLEWQPGMKIAGVLQPIFGALLTSSGAAMGYAGVGMPFDITDKMFLMPSVAVGAYHEGSGHDLGTTLAYRLGAELGWKLPNDSRISLNAHVITNGESFGDGDRTEVIGVKYTMPLQHFKKEKKERPY